LTAASHDTVNKKQAARPGLHRISIGANADRRRDHQKKTNKPPDALWMEYISPKLAWAGKKAKRCALLG
jgi:hypothetical protein